MTDKEIIKALEYCFTNDWNRTKCDKCAFYTATIGCVEDLKSAALDLINRQQAENKELKTENLILSQKRFNIFERIEFTDKLKKQIKSEAIKEFAENCKKGLRTGEIIMDKSIRDIIDNLVKEMVGDNNA